MHDDYGHHNTPQAVVFPSSAGSRRGWRCYAACFVTGTGRTGGTGARAGVAVTRWDARMFGRAVGVTLLAFGMAWVVTAATDEGGVAWGERAGRTLPIVAVCAAIAVWVALAPATARGEGRAMAALGRSRAQVAAAAVTGAALVCALAAAALALSARVDASGFFPTARRANAWRWTGDAFVDEVRGVLVGSDGAPKKLVALGADQAAPWASIPPHGRGAAALALCVAGLAVPLLLAHAMLSRSADRRFGRADGRALGTAIGAVAASVILFQAAAVREVPAVLGAVPPAVLLAFAVWRYRAAP